MVVIVLFIISSILVSAEVINIENISDKYEIISISERLGYMRVDNSNEELSDEVLAKRKAMENYKLLVRKADSEHEVTLAY